MPVLSPLPLMQLRSFTQRPIGSNHPGYLRSSTSVSPVDVDMLQQGKNNRNRYPQSAYAKPSNTLEIVWLVAPPFPLVDLADEARNTPLATVF